MSEIDLCICTFRRTHICETLRSVSALILSDDTSLRVIVADNDDTPSAQILVENTARELGLNLIYIHAPARNISIARNACLDTATAPLIAFIDDDELVTPHWLTVLEAAMTDDVDAVLGPVDALYLQDDWMKRADFHSTRPVFVDATIITGYTCNVLFRRAGPAFLDLRFRCELGRSGGEDTAFFSEAYHKGARIAYAPGAIVTEMVPPGRARFSWLLKRRFRAGQIHGLLLIEKHEVWRLKNTLIAMAKAMACFLAALVFLFHPTRAKQFILRGALHIGVVARLVGKPLIEQY